MILFSYLHNSNICKRFKLKQAFLVYILGIKMPSDKLGEGLQRMYDRYVEIRLLTRRGEYPEKPAQEKVSPATLEDRVEQTKKKSWILNNKIYFPGLAIVLACTGIISYFAAYCGWINFDGNRRQDPSAYATSTRQAMETAYVGAVQTAQAEALATPSPMPTSEYEFKGMEVTYKLSGALTSLESKTQLAQDMWRFSQPHESLMQIFSDPTLPERIIGVDFDHATDNIITYLKEGDKVTLPISSETLSDLIHKYITPENSMVSIDGQDYQQAMKSEKFASSIINILSGVPLQSCISAQCKNYTENPETILRSDVDYLILDDVESRISIVNGDQEYFFEPGSNYQTIRDQLFAMIIEGTSNKCAPLVLKRECTDVCRQSADVQVKEDCSREYVNLNNNDELCISSCNQ